MNSSAFACGLRQQLILKAYEGELPKGSRVLDIGCGNGTISLAIAERFGAIVTGADVANMLAADIPFYLINGPLAFKDKSFDIVTINDALHHMKHPIQETTLKEAARVGKKILIFETHPTLIAKAIDIIMGLVVYRGREAIPLTHKNPLEWQNTLIKLGLNPQIQNLARPFALYPLKHFTLKIQNS